MRPPRVHREVVGLPKSTAPATKAAAKAIQYFRIENIGRLGECVARALGTSHLSRLAASHLNPDVRAIGRSALNRSLGRRDSYRSEEIRELHDPHRLQGSPSRSWFLKQRRSE